MVQSLIADCRRRQNTAIERIPLLAAPLAALAIVLDTAGAAGAKPMLARPETGGWLGGIPGTVTFLPYKMGDSGGPRS
jgi:hypothetical protein